MHTTPLRVALVYNQKKEEATQQSLQDNASEPPSTGHNANDVLVSRTLAPRLAKPSQDLYAEWDSIETIDAVRAALEEVHRVTMIEADDDAYRRLREERPDVVFNMSEGMYGVSREAQM